MIKVLIQTAKYKAGPSVFRSRLIDELSKCDDIKIVNDLGDSFDIELSFIKINSNHNKPNVIRVDGCYYDKKRFGNNKDIRNSIVNASYVIYQSEFSRSMCETLLKVKNKNNSVVYNGIDYNWIDSIEPDLKVEPGSFVACANWRNNKRPISTIKGFLAANTGKHLYMLGDGVKYKDKRIHCIGNVDSNKAISIMKGCSYQIHLCHIDSCPNAVIEGLSCGLNVLCTNLGGTPELVKGQGVVINVDKWSGKICDNVNFDNLNEKVIAAGVQELIKLPKPVSKQDHLNITYVANEYAQIIRNLM